MSDKVLPWEVKFNCGCPRCGYSVQTVTALAPDYGKTVSIYIPWCMNCLEVVGKTVVVKLGEA